MKTISIIVIAALACGCAAKSRVKPLVSTSEPVTTHVGPVCMLKAPLPQGVGHTVVAIVKGAKSTPGSVNELLAPMADDARKLGAHAVINMKVWQKFNFLVAVRPVGSGTAVRLTNPAGFDCLANGGELR